MNGCVYVCAHDSEIMIPFLPFLNPYLLSAYRLSCMHIIHLVLVQFHHQSQQKRIEVAKGNFRKTNAHLEIAFIFALSQFNVKLQTLLQILNDFA